MSLGADVALAKSMTVAHHLFAGMSHLYSHPYVATVCLMLSLTKSIRSQSCLQCCYRGNNRVHGVLPQLLH